MTQRMIEATPEAFRLMMDASEAFADLEERGIRVDRDYLDDAIEKTRRKIDSLEEELQNTEVYDRWRKMFGRAADLGKRQQLADVIFTSEDKGGLGKEVIKETKTGRPSTDLEAFEHVDLPFIDKWIYRERVKKMLSTELIGTRKLLDPRGFVHPFYDFHLVHTYRSSSNSPNFQNKTNREKSLARMARRMYIPRTPDHVIVEADYSALEFRGAACFWQDPAMIAYADDHSLDVHRDMAALCYKIEVDRVPKDVRTFGKNKFVFPTLYGSFVGNVASNLWDAIRQNNLQTDDGVGLYDHLADLGINSKDRFADHIREVHAEFEDRFPVWTKKKDIWWSDYIKTGRFPLMTGFVCKGVYTYNNLMNTPIQGPSFHLLLWALIQVNRILRSMKSRSMIIGQIHDSIIMDVHKDELQDVLNLLEDMMTVKVREHWDWVLTTLEIEVEVGEQNWWEKKEYVKDNSGTWRAV